MVCSLAQVRETHFLRNRECCRGNVYKANSMKRRALLILSCVGFSPVLFSSCSSVGGTAGNGTGSHAQATAGSGGMQWTGGNYVSTVLPEVDGTAGNETGSHVKVTAGSDGVQWSGGNYVSTVLPEVEGTAGNETDSHVKVTAGSDGVQWSGGHYVSNAPSGD